MAQTVSMHAVKIAANTTITGKRGESYRSGGSGIVFVPDAEVDSEMQTRTGITVATATALHLTQSGDKNGTTTTITFSRDS